MQEHNYVHVCLHVYMNMYVRASVCTITKAH